ncbi:M48 family metalloprotease [Pontivivens ytuae]|uniref:M48 family metalloprotease n=1 Tax=Pontivivens ytuae TaxID=2789856 RepID=A0A7S9LUG7_9RHOB|nr:M48 family metalloprotease [Pontivivens ytuae]QPH55479.1 M48 family metalloprotease [Pontivivens ytuae]
MRVLISAMALTVLAACETTYALPEVGGSANIPNRGAVAANRSVSSGESLMRQVAQRVEPIAESTCRQETGQSGQYCDFRILVEDTGDQPNAFQTFRDGRPLIIFNTAMLRTVRNDNEVAFIMSHEAGHHIAGHLQRRQQQVGLGGLLGAITIGALGGDPQQGADLGASVGSRAYSQAFELEADLLGTYIADRAGYDPVDGAASFARFGGSNSILSTHPPGPQRYNTVVAAARQIEQQRARGITPTIPRN